MSRVVDFLERPAVLVIMGALMLVLAIFAFAGGGRGIITGVVLTIAGGHSLWRGSGTWRSDDERPAS